MKTLVTGGSGYLGIHVRRFFDADDFSRRSNLDILDLKRCRARGGLRRRDSSRGTSRQRSRQRPT